MGEYFAALLAVSVLSALGSYMAYNPSDKTTRCAIALIVLYTATVYAVGIADTLCDTDPEAVLGEGDIDYELSDTEYANTAREAFALGVKRAVAEKFGLLEKEISVSVDGFDARNMTAQRINVLLSGSAAYADWRAVEEFVRSSGLGECRAEVYLG